MPATGSTAPAERRCSPSPPSQPFELIQGLGPVRAEQARERPVGKQPAARIRGSVSARFSVRFSAVSAPRNSSRLQASGSMPPGSTARSADSPRSTCSEARRFVPASVSTSEPSSKSKAASELRPASFAGGARQCSRPPTMRCTTSQSSCSSPIATRLPTRRSSLTRCPETASIGGSAVRSKNALAMRTCFSVRPTMRGSSACRYAAMSGSSGTAPTRWGRRPSGGRRSDRGSRT